MSVIHLIRSQVDINIDIEMETELEIEMIERETNVYEYR